MGPIGPILRVLGWGGRVVGVMGPIVLIVDICPYIVVPIIVIPILLSPYYCPHIIVPILLSPYCCCPLPFLHPLVPSRHLHGGFRRASSAHFQPASAVHLHLPASLQGPRRRGRDALPDAHRRAAAGLHAASGRAEQLRGHGGDDSYAVPRAVQRVLVHRTARSPRERKAAAALRQLRSQVASAPPQRALALLSRHCLSARRYARLGDPCSCFF